LPGHRRSLDTSDLILIIEVTSDYFGVLHSDVGQWLKVNLG
jgi:hypothetical protein